MTDAKELFEQIQTLNALPELFPTNPKNDSFSRQLEEASLPSVMKALLHLWNNDLESCHQIVQQHEMPDENYLHAILHRREKDFSNSLYWLRRVGQHPVLKHFKNAKWTPENFIHACEQFEKSPATSAEKELLEWQAMEMQVLFNHFLEQT